MAEDSGQSYANHSRIDPAYHYFVFGVLGLNVLATLWVAVRHFSGGAAWNVLVAVALVVLCYRVRTYSLTVQDRVIRLEERLRLAGLLPDPLRARIGELSTRQLIALRFASDGEVAPLVEKALSGLAPAEIKRQITSWRTDNLRV